MVLKLGETYALKMKTTSEEKPTIFPIIAGLEAECSIRRAWEIPNPPTKL
jgi:hypothetical protein